MKRADLISRLAEEIAAVVLPHPTRVAIDGIDAAGKTTLAEELVAPLERMERRVVRASIDGFHRPRSERYRRGKDSPEGYYCDSFDHAAVRRDLLEPLGPGGDRRYRTAAFDYRKDAPVDSPLLQAPVDAILLLDGVFLLRPELFGCWDLTIFVHVGFETSLARALERDLSLFGDGEAVRERYEKRYIPGQDLYFAESKPQERAAFVVFNEDVADPRLVIQVQNGKRI
ncbi:MAG: uridine kinase [Anaerolineales bacterium]